ETLPARRARPGAAAADGTTAPSRGARAGPALPGSVVAMADPGTTRAATRVARSAERRRTDAARARMILVMSEPLVAPSSDFMRFLLAGQSGGFTPFARALDGLSGEDAVRRPDGSPHSVAEVVAHLVFWQDRFLRMVDGEPPSPVPHASDGWPAVSADEWPDLVARFLANRERFRALAADEAELSRPLVAGKDRSVGAAVAYYHMHDVHHHGQVILLRRTGGATAPPGGCREAATPGAPAGAGGEYLARAALAGAERPRRQRALSADRSRARRGAATTPTPSTLPSGRERPSSSAKPCSSSLTG